MIAFVMPVLGAGSWHFSEYSVTVEAADMPLEGKVNGYQDIVLNLTNTSPVDYEVEIKLLGGSDSAIRSISKTVQLPAGRKVEAAFIKPYLEMRNVEVKIWINKDAQKPFKLDAYTDDSYNFWTSTTSILLSEELSYDFFDKLLNEDDKRASSRDNQITIFRGPRLLETQYAYSGFACVLLKASMIEQSSDKAKSILYNYVSAGGSLFVFGDFVPQTFAINAKNAGILSFYELGLGLIAVAKTENYKEIESLDWKEISEGLWKNKPSIYKYVNASDDINKWFGVVEVAPVPVKLIVAMIALLVIIIGPVNILVLRLINKPILMFVTVPVISILGAIVILVSSISKEGTANTEKISAFSIFDQRNGAVTTAAVLGYYCPVLSVDELVFDLDTQVLPLNIGYRYGGDRCVSLDSGQKFYGGWINSRVPAQFAAIKTSVQASSLVDIITLSDGTVEAVNKSGGTIESIRYKSGDGQLWQAEKVAPGQKVVLAAYDDNKSSIMLFPIRDMMRQDWLKSGSKILATPYKYLHEGCYIAKFNDLLFMESPSGKQTAIKSSESFVYGITGDAQ